MSRTALVTGGCGFIGSHLIMHLLEEMWTVINLDANTYAAADGARFASRIDGEYLRGSIYFPVNELGEPTAKGVAVHNENHIWIKDDVGNPAILRQIVRDYQPDVFFHLAAETHVDRSIDGPGGFLGTNIIGTHTMLVAFRDACDSQHAPEKFVYVSTDEVYGSFTDTDVPAEHDDPRMGGFQECHATKPGNVYSATKLAAEALCQAYHNTWDLPIVITRGCNTYGTHQVPEKFLPVMVDNALHGRRLPVYGDGMQQRQWMHVDDHVSGIITAWVQGQAGEIYNVGVGQPLPNIWMVNQVLRVLDKPHSLIEYVKDRPGHDRGYFINPAPLGALGWKVEHGVGEGDTESLDKILLWYASEAGQSWIRFTKHNTARRLGLCEKESS